MLPILVDEDMPRPTAGLLQSLGIDAIDLRDIGLKGATDAEVFEHAQKQRMIIISRDKEFTGPSRGKPSQIELRQGPRRSQLAQRSYD